MRTLAMTFGLAVLFATSLSTATVASGEELKIGFVILPRLLAETEVGKAARQELRTTQASMQEEVDKKLGEIQDFVEDIRKRAMLLSEDEKKKASQEHERQLRDAKRLQEDLQRDLQKAETEVMEKVQQELLKVIRNFGIEHGYDLVLDVASILHASAKADLTDEIIEAANSAK